MRRAWLAMTGAVLALGRPAPALAGDGDPWLSHDKALHFGVSAVLAQSAYGASSFALEPRWQRAAVAGGLALSVGAAKELYDLSGRGDPSWRDLTADAAGCALGAGLSALLDWGLATRKQQVVPYW